MRKQDEQDRLRRQDMDKFEISTLQTSHIELTAMILRCCFDVINELGAGFLESVYKNALFVALKQKGLRSGVEQSFDVYFREQKVGFYKTDLIIENSVIIELKCCKCLLPEHQAQLINYLAATKVPVGLLVNFENKKLEYKRLHHPSLHPAAEGDLAYPVL